MGARVYGAGARVYGVGARVYGVGARVYGSLVILVSAQVLLVLTLGLWTSDLGLTIFSGKGRGIQRLREGLCDHKHFLWRCNCNGYIKKKKGLFTNDLL